MNGFIYYCQCLCCRYIRKDSIAAGKFSLNVTKCPSESLFMQSLCEIIEDFTTHVSTVRLMGVIYSVLVSQGHLVLYVVGS